MGLFHTATREDRMETAVKLIDIILRVIELALEAIAVASRGDDDAQNIVRIFKSTHKGLADALSGTDSVEDIFKKPLSDIWGGDQNAPTIYEVRKAVVKARASE